jgi:hypothetical protein
MISLTPTRDIAHEDNLNASTISQNVTSNENIREILAKKMKTFRDLVGIYEKKNP